MIRVARIIREVNFLVGPQQAVLSICVLADLPDGVDPCGEKGEFHSFVYAGPMLSVDIPVSVGESIVRDQFVFAELRPATISATFSSQ